MKTKSKQLCQNRSGFIQISFNFLLAVFCYSFLNTSKIDRALPGEHVVNALPVLEIEYFFLLLACTRTQTHTHSLHS